MLAVLKECSFFKSFLVSLTSEERFRKKILIHKEETKVFSPTTVFSVT